MNVGKVNETLTRVCAFIEEHVNPNVIEDITRIPYSPDKTSAKASAAIIGSVIPVITKGSGMPVLVIGGKPSVWVGTHFEPLTDAQVFEVIRSVAMKALLLKPNVLTSEFNKEFRKSFEYAGQPDNVFGYGHEQCRGINFIDGMLIFSAEGYAFVEGHKPEDLTTYCIPGRWRSTMKSEVWDRFMEEAIPEDAVRQYVLASFANAIAGDPLNAQKILLLIGAAGAGKSTMIEAIAGCIGHHNVMRSDNLSQITKDDSRHRMRLAHATLCVSADASSNLGDKDALKMIVSKERIIARKLYSEPIEILPRASLIVASNEMSLTHALSDPGVARRFDIITFNSAKDWHKRDPILHQKLSTDESRAGIGRSLGRALIEIMSKCNNKLQRPIILQQELDDLRRESDPLESFLNNLGLEFDVDELCNSAVIHQDNLYESFRLYCAQNGYREWSIRKFKSRLRSSGAQEHDAGSRKHKYAFRSSDLQQLKRAKLIM